MVVPPPDAFVRQDPDYLCSGLLTTQTSTRIDVLQNYIPYVVGVASVDLRGNASAISTAVLQQPIATRDFYKEYRAAGGTAEGGCALGGRASGGNALAVALLALATAVRRRRR
jgi:hypothetical protein